MSDSPKTRKFWQLHLSTAVLMMFVAGLFVGACVWLYQNSGIASIRVSNRSGKSVHIGVKLAIRKDETEQEMNVWQQYLDPLDVESCALKPERQYWIEVSTTSSANQDSYGFWTERGKLEDLEIGVDGKIIRKP